MAEVTARGMPRPQETLCNSAASLGGLSNLQQAQTSLLEDEGPQGAAEAVLDQPVPAGLAAACGYMSKPRLGQQNRIVGSHPNHQPIELGGK